MGITLDQAHLKGFVAQKDIEGLLPQIEKAHRELEEKTGAGNDFTGWTDLPGRIDDALLDELVTLGKDVRKDSEAIVSIGIGGSYLGIRAVLEFLGGGEIPVYYAGHNISVDYHAELLESLKDKNFTVVVISKSGTTTEPALAFRLIKDLMKDKYSAEEMAKRIICVTDAQKGALRGIADAEGYRSYVIPDDIGGRFSVLTPVGLVPLAIAGVDIHGFVAGARQGQELYSSLDLSSNIAYQYAAIRYLLYKNQSKRIEVTSSFYENFYYSIEWWKQLYGESEGKNGQGIFPASLILSTDLHSMGQLLQDGERNIFETFLVVDKQRHTLAVPQDAEDRDKFNIVAGKDLDYVNKQAYKATAEAHFEGGVPNMSLTIDKSDAVHLGQLFYFYQRAVAISGYMLGINPFDQPGVEAYKKKMFALLGRV